jgi:hypothetical protein
MTEISQEAVERVEDVLERGYELYDYDGIRIHFRGHSLPKLLVQAVQAQVLQRVIGDLVDGYVADPSELCPPIVETLDAIKAELQAQVLAGVKERLLSDATVNAVKAKEQSRFGKSKLSDYERRILLDAALATLNPNEGEGFKEPDEDLYREENQEGKG